MAKAKNRDMRVRTLCFWAGVCFGVVGCGGRGGKQEPENLPPEFRSTPPTDVTVYTEYFYQIMCSDPDGDEVILETGAEDTCDGTFTDYGNGAGTYVFAAEPDRAGTDCVVDLLCSDAELQTGQTATVSIAPAADITDLGFGRFEPWATPVADYIQINTDILGHIRFLHGIHDLAVFEDRLYIGYGDANLNLGRNTPIELRYWEREVPEAVRSDFIVDEEQVSLYRRFGEVLVIPGVDATEDGLMGNAYTLTEGGSWYKSRTLDLGWHVHDALLAGDTGYACGSGGTMDDYNNSTVNAFLWRTTDGGATYEILEQLPHPNPPGDHRLLQLLSVNGTVYAFGYYTTQNPDTTYATAYELTANGLEPWTGSQDFFVYNTCSLLPDAGLLVGVKIQNPLLWGGLLVTGSGAETAQILEGRTLLDALPLGDGRTLLMYIEGDAYPTPDHDTWEVHVALTTNGTDLAELATQAMDTRPLSIGFWRRSLFMGMDDGSVWRATGTEL